MARNPPIRQGPGIGNSLDKGLPALPPKGYTPIEVTSEFRTRKLDKPMSPATSTRQTIEAFSVPRSKPPFSKRLCQKIAECCANRAGEDKGDPEKGHVIHRVGVVQHDHNRDHGRAVGGRRKVS